MVKAVEYDAEHGAKRQESEGRRVSKKCPKCGGEVAMSEKFESGDTFPNARPHAEAVADSVRADVGEQP